VRQLEDQKAAGQAQRHQVEHEQEPKGHVGEGRRLRLLQHNGQGAELGRLVDRKLASSAKTKAFCVCMARNVCFASGRPTASANPKK
jgi:hypothetical protein